MNRGRIPGLVRPQPTGDDRCQIPSFAGATFECPAMIKVDACQARSQALPGSTVFRSSFSLGTRTPYRTNREW